MLIEMYFLRIETETENILTEFFDTGGLRQDSNTWHWIVRKSDAGAKPIQQGFLCHEDFGQTKGLKLLADYIISSSIKLGMD